MKPSLNSNTDRIPSFFFISNSSHPCTEITLDSNRIRAFYSANGWVETADPSLADDLIVSTCAFNQHYEDEGVTDIEGRKKSLKSGARMIVTGCLSGINPERLQKIGSFTVVGPLDLDRFDSLISASKPIRKIHSYSVRFEDYRANPFFQKLVRIKEKLSLASKRFGFNMVPAWMATIPLPTWFFIRGSVGCLGKCTYCAVRRAKGRLVSTPIDTIVSQVEKAVAQGAGEISLAGDDMGAWGQDLNSNLAELLGTLLKISGEFVINIRFVEPLFFITLLDKLLPIFATGRISAFCLPIQSGSNAVLNRMGRDYSIEAVETALEKVAALPGRPNLASILMVGFPGETEDDYNATVSLVDRLPIDLFQILTYEGRPGTPSTTMPDQISPETKKIRHDRLSRKFKLQKVVGLPKQIVNLICDLD